MSKHQIKKAPAAEGKPAEGVKGTVAKTSTHGEYKKKRAREEGSAETSEPTPKKPAINKPNKKSTPISKPTQRDFALEEAILHGSLIKEPHNHDVLAGRGNFVNYHIGNEHFRALVRKHKVAYVACPKPQKPHFARLIYEEIKAQNPPGRFLKQDPKTKLWHDIGEKKALDKTRQALREGAPEIKSDMSDQIAIARDKRLSTKSAVQPQRMAPAPPPPPPHQLPHYNLQQPRDNRGFDTARHAALSWMHPLSAANETVARAIVGTQTMPPGDATTVVPTAETNKARPSSQNGTFPPNGTLAPYSAAIHGGTMAPTATTNARPSTLNHGTFPPNGTLAPYSAAVNGSTMPPTNNVATTNNARPLKGTFPPNGIWPSLAPSAGAINGTTMAPARIAGGRGAARVPSVNGNITIQPNGTSAAAFNGARKAPTKIALVNDEDILLTLASPAATIDSLSTEPAPSLQVSAPQPKTVSSVEADEVDNYEEEDSDEEEHLYI